MKKNLNMLLHAVLFVVLLVAVGFAFVDFYLKNPNHLTNDVNVIIPKSTGGLEIAEILTEAEVLRFPHLFYLTQIISGKARKFKAGEYIFAAGTTPNQIADKLKNGEVVIHKITIPEGWNMREVRAYLNSLSIVEGEITRPMPEGSILPETYHYIYGDTRDELILRMQSAMEKTITKLWEERATSLPFTNKNEALILASIVEKETGEASERARVAAVFINRLRLGMRLQTDPSVIYGIENKINDTLGRELTRADLEMPTEYNTYLIKGLPPTPIANPGIKAIEAVLNPLATDELYFVANGKGGHNFARNLDEHNKNVEIYRKSVITNQ